MKSWLVRDIDGNLFLHFDKSKENSLGDSFIIDEVIITELPRDLFPEVTFENSPQQVEIKLIK